MMKKKTLITIAISVALFGGILWLATGPSQKAEVTSAAAAVSARLFASESSFDFGTVSMAQGIVKKRVTITNEGPDSVVIGKLSTSCMCTTATLIKGEDRFGPFGMPGHGYIPKLNQTIGPKEEAAVEIAFDPAAHGPAGVGRVDRSVYLENNAGKPLEIQFTATVTP